MENAFWYVLSCLLVALYFFAAGATYTFEYIVLVLFDAYVYYPEILPIAYFDNVLGSVVSNAFNVPMACVFVASFELPFKKYLVVMTAILGIEGLFVYSGIYEHHWWRIIYTEIGLFAGFITSKKWLTILHRGMTKYKRFIDLHFTSLVIHASLVFIITGIFNIYIYRIVWFEDPYRSHIAFATAYIFVQSAIFSLICIHNFRWSFIIIGLLLFSGFDILLLNVNILVFLKSWNVFYSFFIRIFILGVLFLIDRYILRLNPFSQDL